MVTDTNLFYVPFVGPAFTSTQNNGVEVVSANGVPLRRLPAGYGGPIAVSVSGIVYQLGYNYSGRMALLACRGDGSLLWRRDVTYSQSGSVMVGRQGIIYISDGSAGGSQDTGEVAAYTSAGHPLWRRVTSGGFAVPAERGDGVILVADRTGLTALRPAGRRLWHRALGRVPARAESGPSLAVDAAGRAYVGGLDGKVRAIAPNGKILWTVGAGGRSRQGFSPSIALGPRGILAVVGTDQVLRVYD